MKFCSKCGNQVDDQTVYCPKCGEKLILSEEEKVKRNKDRLFGDFYKPKRIVRENPAAIAAFILLIISTVVSAILCSIFVYSIFLALGIGVDSNGLVTALFILLLYIGYFALCLGVTIKYKKNINDFAKSSTLLKVGIFFVNFISFILVIIDEKC